MAASDPCWLVTRCMDESVNVYGTWMADGHCLGMVIKSFPFNPDDEEDKAFAIRQAEELIDKLKEK